MGSSMRTIAIVLSFIATAARAQDNHFVIHVTSFTSNPNWAGQGDPTAAIVMGAESWLQYAHANMPLVYDGPTTAAGCGTGVVPNNVAMNTSCPLDDPHCCSAIAFWDICFVGSTIQFLSPPASTISVCPNPVPTRWRLRPTSLNDTDLQAIATHEFGHNIFRGGDITGAQDFNGHITPTDTPFCVMTKAIEPPQVYLTAARYFCNDEIRAAPSANLDYPPGAHSGPALGPPAITSSSGPITTGWSTPAALAQQSGIGLGVISRGVVLPSAVRDSYFKTAAAGDSIPLSSRVLCDYRSDGVSLTCSTSWTTTVANPQALRRGTVAYDTSRGVWWRFQPGDTGPRNVVAVESSSDRVNWSSHGLLRGSNLANATTRAPVAAVYDPVSTAIFVLVNHYDEINTFPSPSCGGTWGICNEDIVLYKILPDSGTMVGPFSFTQSGSRISGFGSPALACGTSSLYGPWPYTTFNCFAIVASNNADRVITAWTFRAQNNIFNSAEFELKGSVAGGVTTALPAVAYDGPSATFVAAIRGLSTNQIFLSFANYPTYSWSGWSTASAGSTPILSRLGPSLAGSAGAGPALDMLIVP